VNTSKITDEYKEIIGNPNQKIGRISSPEIN
jgi:hypothetical protein